MFNPINALLGLFSYDIGIDLGTANTLVMVKGRGIVIDEPSVVAIDRETRKVEAVGSEAKEMVGRTPARIVAVRPLRDGVISDFDTTERMLDHFIRKVHARSPFMVPRPRVVVGIPSGVTEVERRAVHDAVLNAGGRECFLVSEPMAAAIGAGLPVSETGGSMIVDIGGGTTEVAVISRNGMVASRSIRVAGDEMDEDLINAVRLNHNLLIGERTAEQIKLSAGSAYPLKEEAEVEIRGRDLITGLPRTLVLSTIEIREALSPPINSIVGAVKDTIESTPPELIADLMDRGIALAGGGALLSGIDRRLAQETKFHVYRAEDPMTCVVRGTGLLLENFDRMREVLTQLTYRRRPVSV